MTYPYSPASVEGKSSETRNTNPHPGRSMSGMYRWAQACYSARSYERAEAQNRVSSQLGTQGTWGASSATGCRTECRRLRLCSAYCCWLR